jgi:NADH:ubiquinone oxidoreductase subunit 5 (subunit L)/multisubunit Na+/H+ antiporter MnhA subunit
VLLGIIAVFISLVTLASFLKFFGGAFLGECFLPLERAREGDAPFSMQLPQVVLALACIGFGLVPMLALAGVHRAIGSLATFAGGPSLASLVGESWLGLRLSLFDGVETGVWLPMAGLAAVVLASALAYGLSRAGGAQRRAVSMWHCGAQLNGVEARYVVVEPKTEPATAEFESRYRAHGLYGAFIEAFRTIYPTVKIPRVPYPRSFMSIFDAEAWLFRPLVRAGGWLTDRFSRTHSGVPQQYLIWQLVGLVGVILGLYLLTR